MKCHEVEALLHCPDSPNGDKENCLLRTLQGSQSLATAHTHFLWYMLLLPSAGGVRVKLRGHASKTLVALGRYLARISHHQEGEGGEGIVLKAHLQQALQIFHINLAQEASTSCLTVLMHSTGHAAMQ